MSDTLLLCPRPLARCAGRLLLLPLLPQRPPLKPLPSEIWSEVFSFVLSESLAANPLADRARLCMSLVMVCRSFKDVALPLMYGRIKIRTVSCLDKLSTCLCAADQKWDSIRRIPYSTPGRWVQVLDLSELADTVDSRLVYTVDLLLTNLFPLVPFLTKLCLTPAVPLSRRVFSSLTNRDGNSNLRSLGGICYDASFHSPVATGGDPFVRLLQRCYNLERLEIIGRGFDSDFESFPDALFQEPASTVKLFLPKLHSLTILSMPTSSLLVSLLDTRLPRLRALSITPYDDIPYPASCTSRFLDVHGQSIFTLSFFTPKSWPTLLHPSPSTLFHTCPNLRHLSLEYPLPELALPDSTLPTLPLQIVSIPRPDMRFWRVLERLLPYLPSLKAVRIRDVRWLDPGMSNRAQETGVQGELRNWRRRLGRRGIRVLDADWQDMR
ncbi:hypothetical protein F5J12DRAFT_828519 [Pisolithus orientalis]|uniref:uncharacterized protein n=1 Tax=Pisolithus orientalis TaxID=936130 RepID=UPI002225417B|nr:uncharacterized protein F5J12DRAFT_828519 [Pisolithus orientalis]KAI6008402.1 hypothetical protein F5J12DRAFT_828519 [Pisolithus orientalis]